MGCRLMLDSGLSGGFRVGSEGAESTSVLLDIHFREPEPGTPRQLDMICEDPMFILICSFLSEHETLLMGNVTWSVSGDCSALHVVGLVTITVGMLGIAVRQATEGLG